MRAGCLSMLRKGVHGCVWDQSFWRSGESVKEILTERRSFTKSRTLRIYAKHEEGVW